MKRKLRNIEVEEYIDHVAEYPPSVKNLLSAVTIGLRNRNWSEEDVREFFSSVGYPVTRPTLYRWNISTIRRGIAVQPHHGGGRERILDAYQMGVLAGWVLTQNKNLISVEREMVRKFLKEELDAECSAQTCGNSMEQLGFTWQSLKSRNSGYGYSRDELARRLFRWVSEHASVYDRSKVCCIDVTYTSHRTDRLYGFAPAGKPAPYGAKKISPYTNCIITCIWADGVDRTPAVLFTYNAEFDTERPGTKRRDAQRRKFFEVLESVQGFGVKESQIHVVSKEEHTYPTFVSEKSDLIRAFFGKYGIPPNCHIFSDNGNCFKEGKVDVLLDLGFEKHTTFLPEIHQFLSTCDNYLYGAAKIEWRQMFDSFVDDVKCSIWLLALIHKYYPRVPEMFEKNMLLRSSKPSQDRANALIKKASKFDEEFHRACLFDFKYFMGMDTSEDVDDTTKGIDSSLDGKYWLS